MKESADKAAAVIRQHTGETTVPRCANQRTVWAEKRFGTAAGLVRENFRIRHAPVAVERGTEVGPRSPTPSDVCRAAKMACTCVSLVRVGW